MKYNLLQRADRSKDLQSYSIARRFIFELSEKLEGMLRSNRGSSFYSKDYNIIIKK